MFALNAAPQKEKGSWIFGSWYPDSTRFIATVRLPGAPSTIWSIPVQGGDAAKIAEVDDMFGGGAVSPDGQNIAYERLQTAVGGREIWVMGLHGESPTRWCPWKVRPP